MNAKTKAMTPSPEEIAELLPILLRSGSANGRPDVQDWLIKHSSAIVRAVNAHEELLEALKLALNKLRHYAYGNQTVSEKELIDLFPEIYQAITKAEARP